VRRVARPEVRYERRRRTRMSRVLIVDENPVTEVGLRSPLNARPGIDVVGGMPVGGA
jgi:hypothetical protein